MTAITATNTSSITDEEPLLEQSMKCTYSELVSCVNGIELNESSITLPMEISEWVAQFLVILPVQTFRAVSYSSKRKNIVPILPENPNINDDNNTCWSSEKDTMSNGIGRQYIEYDVTIPNKTTASRLSSVSIANPCIISIGVRDFQLEAILHNDNDNTVTTDNDDVDDQKNDNDNNNWTVISDIFTVTTAGKRWEKFTIEPVDVSRIRIVFLSNQSSSIIGGKIYSHVYCYSMKFE